MVRYMPVTTFSTSTFAPVRWSWQRDMQYRHVIQRVHNIKLGLLDLVDNILEHNKYLVLPPQKEYTLIGVIVWITTLKVTLLGHRYLYESYPIPKTTADLS